MKNMSTPTFVLIILMLLVVGYFVGQALHLDRKPAAAPVAATTVAVSTQL